MHAMHVNGKSESKLPPTLSIRTTDLAPLLVKWREQNLRVPWSCLLRDALKKELAPLAGKRHRHLIDERVTSPASEARSDAFMDLHTKRNLRRDVAKLRAQANGNKGKAA